MGKASGWSTKVRDWLPLGGFILSLALLLSLITYQYGLNSVHASQQHAKSVLALIKQDLPTLIARNDQIALRDHLVSAGQADSSIVSLQISWPGLNRQISYQRASEAETPVSQQSEFQVGQVPVQLLLVTDNTTAAATHRLLTFEIMLLFLLIVASSMVVVRRLRQNRTAINNLSLSAGVFTHAREGILIIDPDGQILNVNQAFCDFAGYRTDQLTGRTVDLLKSGRHSEDFYAQLVQLLFKQGYWNGEIWFQAKNGAYLAALVTISAVYDEHHNIQKFFAFCSDITKQMLQQRKLEQIAHYDTLTQLPNRVLLSDRLHHSMLHALRRNQQLAIVFIDLDGFKEINDNFGHHTGDQLLLTLATRMTQSIRQGDTISRLGGDEFVAVLGGLNSTDDCLPLLHRLLDVINEPVHLDGQLLQVSGSLGVTFFPQTAVVDADQLLLQADQSMYQAKLKGKNCFHIFSQLTEDASAAPVNAASRVAQALAAGEFQLHYEPIVDLHNGVMIGVEAHIRWLHPEKGTLSPSVFLSGLNPATLHPGLDLWALRTGCAQLTQWLQQGLQLRLHFNMHPATLLENNFQVELGHCLAEFPEVAPDMLVLELQEAELLSHMNRLSPVLSACAEQGVLFALDDFSPGDRSLAYLNMLPMQVLKAEKAFLRGILDDVEDLCMVQSVLDAAIAFQRELVADGIDTLSHGEQLIRLGYWLGQGYAIAEPMQAAEIPNWNRTWQLPERWQRACPVNERDLPLLYARPEQQQWLRRVEHFLQGNSQSDELLAEHCYLCQWLHRLDPETQGYAPYLEKTQKLHRQMHQVTESLLNLQPEHRQQALYLLTELKELHLRLDAVIDDLLVNRGKRAVVGISEI